jgi:hypothetical protein
MKWLIAVVSIVTLISRFSNPVGAGVLQGIYLIDDNNLKQIAITDDNGNNNLKQIGVSDRNNLKQIGIPIDDMNNLKQIAIGLHDATGTYFGDGSVRTIGGIGSNLYVSPDWGSSGALCVRNIGLRGGITDGTSNTILIGERTGFQISPGYATPFGPVGSILDGTSNTIFFPERGATEFCLGNTGFEQPGIGEVVDGTTNTIVFGENSSVDFCFASARVGTIADGTSNTVLFGETRSNLCFQGLHPASDLVQGVAEPPSAAILTAALLALAIGLFMVTDRNGFFAKPVSVGQS